MRCVLTLLLLFVIFWQGTSTSAKEKSQVARSKVDLSGSLEISGRKRLYDLHVPASCRGKKDLPLVLVFHGAMENGRVIRKLTGMDHEADANEFIVAYPYGSGRLRRKLLMWNAYDCCGLAIKRNIDDVAFVSALIDKLCNEFPVDRRKVFACGYSNGAMFCLRLAAELSDKIAAIGSVGGSMSGKEKTPGDPVSVLIIHGDDDRHVPYKGGTGKWARWGYPVNKQPVSFSVDFWKKANNCQSDAEIRDDENVKTEVFKGGTAGAELKVITMKGARHNWPGGKQSLLYTDKAFQGLDATRECWTFFAEHPKKE